MPYRVDQTDTGRTTGNCFQAAVASVLDLPLVDVPHFCNNAADDWYERFGAWLAKFDLYPIMLTDPETIPPGWSIVSGHSPRYPDDPDRLHATVYLDGEPWHDPHPIRAFLLGVSDAIVFVSRLAPLASGGSAT